MSRPNATVQWLRNGEILKSDTRVQIDSRDVVRKLVLTGLQPSDSGKYICDAVDDKLVTVVEVQGKSGFTHQQKPVPRTLGLLLKKWSWFHKGLVFILDPPVKFVNKEAGNIVSAYENESVTLCAVVNREGANVRWLKEGQLLNQDNVHISSEGKTHRLAIDPLQLSDSGQYVCDANTDQMYFSLSAKGKNWPQIPQSNWFPLPSRHLIPITFYTPNQLEMVAKFTKPLENAVSLKGGTLVLRCEVNKPKGDVQWLKDGKDIQPSRRHTIRAQGRERTFTIHQLVEEDSGEYACETTCDRTSATVAVKSKSIERKA